jgi:hypothetical protein
MRPAYSGIGTSWLPSDRAIEIVVDLSGAVSRILAKDYRFLETVSGTGIRILRRV